ncbi:hypothetical protein E2C01_059840 [Portunus trituberculatus]|uniref:Uncharacterized protein n=1 Tax=Portunus trituberculatus TaxID=210409 RepID=A0A5B7HAE5_PORTR|nr:hypothetical protein [Portunus trituberculatus]
MQPRTLHTSIRYQVHQPTRLTCLYLPHLHLTPYPNHTPHTTTTTLQHSTAHHSTHAALIPRNIQHKDKD